jgi:phage/plasmid primase-like uncharacterized protein
MKTVEAAKGQWAMIFEHYGLPPITGKNHFRGKCPLCDSVGKFRIDDRDGAGTWICTCGSGDGNGAGYRNPGQTIQRGLPRNRCTDRQYVQT